MSSGGIRKNTRNPVTGSTASLGETCKTCTPCRRKKVKCDGTRPQCLECTTNGRNCVYPRDARRVPRPSQTLVQSLEATVATMREHLKASGISPVHVQLQDCIPPVQGNAGTDVRRVIDQDQDYGHSSQSESLNYLASTAAVARPLPTPPSSISMRQDFPSAIDHIPYQPNRNQMMEGRTGLGTPHLQRPVSTSHSVDTGYSRVDSAIGPRQMEQEAEDTAQDYTGVGGTTGMSPCEARVAGAFHEHGCVSTVHGLSSIMNPTSRAQHKENISNMVSKGESAIAASKARLISNAALQRQREARIFRQPSNTMDLDGCEPELAKHLLDLHFNRQHYAYLISYRPAIMGSLANGGGPWVNKLLLNAIYYSSTLYSDRPYLRSKPDDLSSVGAQFYTRFRQLLGDAIDKPSIPSAMALLLTSATLVSQGHSSAGWNLSGTAYRMIIDMGCHLMLGPDHESTATSSDLLTRDLEREMRTRLYWGAFATDATQSLYLGRPCMFASTEARVPMRFLDTFEELEEWEPYIDPGSLAPPPPAYASQPAYAVSTFTCLVRLFQISAKITDLYGIQTIKCSSEDIRNKKASIIRELDKWSDSLPDHLKFDPDGSFIPPPHHITPLTTYHALTILLNRAFLEEGHLRRHRAEGDHRKCEEACINSALAIQKFVRAYRKAFTLRRAPFLLSYAVYSAVIVIIRQERHDRGQFMEPISFFWTCLSELQHGCNVGLKKPLSILRDMVHEFRVSVKEGGLIMDEMPQLTSLDESFFQLPMNPPSNEPSLDTPGDFVSDYLGMEAVDVGLENFSPDFLDSMNELQKDVTHDTLYGLFAHPTMFR
ncbi:fungal-specific transcription factor domain-containing protein [Penicillium odoratum]|uniref:fungal-specific transcription factor domain-containing protein n=1 Tax=Penicillium odoratum TaxID=1167516 RepID=UPI0025479942|nr:fungal-specific transcription factor domain-containing protein [Penicillium odoratum]KAJ5772465.1 fungal-specific transcription factor domain-containing protein [Penicillium odoratum]